MRKLLLLAFLFASGAALADGIQNMVDQCNEVMRCGECAVTNGPRAKGSTVAVTYRDVNGAVHVEKIDAIEYNYIRDTGYARAADGQFLMCVRVREVMQTPNSVRARGARALFSQTWDRRKYCP